MGDDDHRKAGSLLEVSRPNTGRPARVHRPARRGSARPAMVAGVAVALLAAGGAIFFTAQNDVPTEESAVEAVTVQSGSAAFLASNGARSGVETTASGLQYEILEQGDENGRPNPTDYVLVNYEGRIPGGETFDAGQQVPMPLAGVVPGFSESIQLMSRGSRHRIWIPPALGYGASPPPDSPIQADTVMEFDIELIDFISQERLEALQREAAGQ